MIVKPDYNDAPAYTHFFMNLVQEEDLIEALRKTHQQTLEFIASIPTEKEDYKYEENKWTIKQVFAHIIDCERVYSYRAFRFSRFDATELASFDQNKYADHILSSSKSLKEMLAEYNHIRQATIALFSDMTNEMLDFKGKANNVDFTARGLGFMAVGHNLHHCNVIREKYL